MKWRVIRGLAFLVVCAAFVGFLSALLQPKRRVEIAVDNYHNEHGGLYELDRNTLDVLYIGSSHAFSSVSPEDIFNQYGITGYVQASSCQTLWQSYFFLEETLYTQSPSVVVLDTFEALMSVPQVEAFNREAIDSMRPSPAKLESAWMAERMNPEGEDFPSYLVTALRYHDRWTELSEQDWRYFVTPRKAPAKGFLPRPGTIYAEFNADDYAEGDEIAPMDDICVTYLDRIKALCDEKGISLVLVKYPTCLWSGANYRSVKQWADAKGVLYMDFNADEALRSEVGIDWSVDSLDGGNHLNYDGAMKMTAWMGRWLTENYSFTDKRGLEGYEVWEEDYAYTRQCLLNAELPGKADFAGYAQALLDGEYVCVITSYGIELGSWERGSDCLRQLGVSERFLSETLSAANLAVVSGGQAVFEGIDPELVTYEGGARGIALSARSSRLPEERLCACVWNKVDWGDNSPGLQFIVFDPVTGNRVDNSLWLVNEFGDFSRQ